MEKLEIKSETRGEGRKMLKEARKRRYIPGIVYGPKNKNRNIKINEKDFIKVFNKAGESTLIDLEIDDKKEGKIIIQGYQTDPISDSIIHVDLYQVRMDKKMHAHIPLRFSGESPAVKNEGGVLVKSHNKLAIECLPKDLVHNIEVDISSLLKLNDVIRIKDLNIPPGIEIEGGLEEAVISVIPPRTEKEMEELESEVKEDVEKVEVSEEKEKEEEEEKKEKEEKTAKEPAEQKKEEKK